MASLVGPFCIVLLSPDVGLDVARGHQTSVVPKCLQLACRAMSRRAGVDADHARRLPLEELQHSVRRNLRRTVTLPSASTPWTWKTCLAMSKPVVQISPMGVLLVTKPTAAPWHNVAARWRRSYTPSVQSNSSRSSLHWSKTVCSSYRRRWRHEERWFNMSNGEVA